MYVVIGATGNTGSVVANRLLERGKKVRVIARHADKLQEFARRGAEAFVADASDQAGLTKAFNSAEAVYAIIPPNATTQDFRAEQRRVSEAIAGALEKTGVKHVVSLSSVGADKESGTGPVAGLHEFENRLNRVNGLNVLHLRAAYFMENTLGQAGAIRAMGKTVGPLRSDLKLPIIAARDIGEVAAQELLSLSFTGKTTRELLGERDLSYAEISSIIGSAVDKPDLQYQQLPKEAMKQVFLQLGMSANIADLLLEMSDALNSGHMRALEPRTAKNTTPTSFETWVKEVFVPAYQAQAQAA